MHFKKVLLAVLIAFSVLLMLTACSGTNGLDVFIVPDEPLGIHEASPNGFHYTYLSYYNKKADRNEPVYIMVFPNNSGLPSEDYQYHMDKALKYFPWRAKTFEDLQVMSLMPVFPRDNLYVHALDHHTLKTERPDLVRVDLQLIAMIEDYKQKLEKMGFNVEKKILMEGYSASGMFVNRFVMIHPEMVEAFAAGSCGGWPMLPIAEYEGEAVEFPIGVCDMEALTGKSFDLEALKKTEGYLYGGSSDYNFHVDKDYEDQAIKILGAEYADIWPNVADIYEAYDLSNIDVRLYEGPEMDHGKTFQEAISDVVDFFANIIDN